METDVVVVGAGYAGSVVAERLASAGKRIVWSKSVPKSEATRTTNTTSMGS